MFIFPRVCNTYHSTMVLVLKYLIYDNWEYKGCIKIYLFMSHLCYGIHITVLIENEELMRMESKFLDYI